MLPANVRSRVFEKREAGRGSLGTGTGCDADLFPLQAHEWKSLAPLLLTLFAIGHIDVRIAIVVTRNFPLKTE